MCEETTGGDGPRAVESRKGSYHHGNLRPAVIERAMLLLEEHGAAGLSLRLVARQLGVSQQAPYHHFADKNALLAALAAEGFRELGENVRRSPLEGRSLERRVGGLCVGLVRFARERPELFHLMFGGRIARAGDYPELVDAASASYRMLVCRVRETLDAFEITQFDVDHAAMAIWALGHGLASFILNERIAPEVAAIVGDDGRVLVRHVAAILAAGFASALAPDRREDEDDPAARRRTSHAADGTTR